MCSIAHDDKKIRINNQSILHSRQIYIFTYTLKSLLIPNLIILTLRGLEQDLCWHHTFGLGSITERVSSHTLTDKKKKQVSCSGKLVFLYIKKNEKAKNSCDKSKVHKTFVCFA